MRTNRNHLLFMRLLCLTTMIAASISACKQRQRISNLNEEGPVQSADSISAQAYEVVLNFSGKGTAVVWDLGVLKGLLPNIAPLQQDKTIFTGNSSGSMMAAYFACFGLSTETLQNAIDGFSSLDRSMIPENRKLKSAKLTKGNRTESHAGYLESFATAMLTKNNRRCEPQHPVIIVAANGDVIENRKIEGNGPMIKPHPADKQMRDGTYDVHMVPTSKPQSDVSESNLIGKACTYFVDRIALNILSKIQKRELQCDLRLVSTPDDLIFAVMASVSEPTYYYPILDLDPNDPKVQASKAHMDAATDPFWRKRSPDSKDIVKALQERHEAFRKIDAGQRYYVGGFLMSSPAQDLRRSMPHLYVIGTGRRKLPNVANDLLRAFFLLDTNKMYQINRWWTDLEVQPSQIEEQNSDDSSFPVNDMISLGEAAAARCIAPDQRIVDAKPKNLCAPVEDEDESDPRYNFLVVKPNDEILRTLDGSSITETGRLIPSNWRLK